MIDAKAYKTAWTLKIFASALPREGSYPAVSPSKNICDVSRRSFSFSEGLE